MSTHQTCTEIKCLRCGGFSSATICWNCSNLPDAVDYAYIEQLKRESNEAWGRAQKAERELAKARAALVSIRSEVERRRKRDVARANTETGLGFTVTAAFAGAYHDILEIIDDATRGDK